MFPLEYVPAAYWLVRINDVQGFQYATTLDKKEPGRQWAACRREMIALCDNTAP